MTTILITQMNQHRRLLDTLSSKSNSRPTT